MKPTGAFLSDFEPIKPTLYPEAGAVQLLECFGIWIKLRAIAASVRNDQKSQIERNTSNISNKHTHTHMYMCIYIYIMYKYTFLVQQIQYIISDIYNTGSIAHILLILDINYSWAMV